MTTYRVVNLGNCNDVLSPETESFAQAKAWADESAAHETQPEVVIQRKIGDEWVQITGTNTHESGL